MESNQTSFYDDLSSLYHLIFADWEASIHRQADWLTNIIQEKWGHDVSTVLDVSCGIGTQAIGLAQNGFCVTASDLSSGAIERAKREAKLRDLNIALSVCDMRNAHSHHRQQFDVVISCDNSITHLLNDEDLSAALKQVYDCVRPGGGCLLTVRDYDSEERGTGLIKPYGVRQDGNNRYAIFQVWDFINSTYDLAMYFIRDDGVSQELVTHVMRTRYNAIGTGKLMALMQDAGFTLVERLDGRFYQPVLVGTRAA